MLSDRLAPWRALHCRLLCHTPCMLIDTHCHLDFPDFAADRAEVIKRARLAGVEQIVVPAINVDNFESVLELCSTSESFLPALGLHPCFQHEPVSAVRCLSIMLERHSVVAIGEIGLDFRPGHAEVEVQLALFEQQLKLAVKYGLPVLLHVVKAHDEVLKLLRQYRLARGGIVHAFSGSEQQAREYAKLGFKLGFGGAFTHQRSRKLQRLALELPLEWLVLETDAPDMPLEGYQGQRNEPARVAEVAQTLAELRGISLAQVAQQTCTNARAILSV